MRTLVFAVIAALLIAAGLSSCKTHETCPAYGQITDFQPNTNG